MNTYFSTNISALGGAADCYLKPIVCMQKRMIRYVCHVPTLTTTNPLLKKVVLNKILPLCSVGSFFSFFNY